MKKYYVWISLILALIFTTNAHANTLDNLENPFNMTLRDWMNYSYTQKLMFCTGFIKSMAQENALEITVNDNNIQTYANKLIEPIDFLAKSSDNVETDFLLTAVISSLDHFGWIKKNISEVSNYNTQNTREHPISSQPQQKNKIIKVKPKRNLLNKKSGIAWIKRNISGRGYFPIEELTSYIGDYEKTTDTQYKSFTLEKYYFKRVDITFLVLLPSNEFVGYVTGKMR